MFLKFFLLLKVAAFLDHEIFQWLSKPEKKEAEQILTSKYPKPKKRIRASQIIDEEDTSNSSVGSFAKKYGINSE